MTSGDDKEMLRLQKRIDQLEQLVAELLTRQNQEQESAQASTDDEIELYYPNVEAWVTEEFTSIYAKAVGGDFRWCPRWWEHTEAYLRFEALWRAWERLRLDPAFGMAHWYRDYFDISLSMIVGPRGPFSRCSPERHEPIRQLPVVPAPEGYWETKSVADDYEKFDFKFNSNSKQ
jgi:hypothetical protein